MKTLFCAGLAVLLTGWGPITAQTGEQTPTFTEKEIEALGKAIAESRAQPRVAATAKEQDAKEKVEAKLTEELTKTRTAHEAEFLKDLTSWREVFYASGVAAKNRSPSGRGRVKKETVTTRSQGKETGFEYGVLVPNGYKSTDRYPLIVALHSKDSDGPSYLDAVWGDKKALDKDVLDQFIIVAPTIGEKSLGKSDAQLRIEPFTRVHMAAVALCLRDVLEKYTIDTDRIYLDGTGLGGETAAWLGTMQSKLFAAVCVRSAKIAASGSFNRTDYLANLKNQAPVLILDRADGIYGGAEGAADRQGLEATIQSHGLQITFKTFDALENDRARRVALGKESADPIVEGTKDVAAFFLAHRRNLAPEEVVYTTYDNRLFRQTPWFVLDRANANPEEGTVAQVKAKIDRAANSVNFEVLNVDSLRLLVNDQLFDLDRPIKVIVNGTELLEKKVDRSLEYLMQFSRENAADPSYVMVGDITVNVPQPEPPK